MYCVYVEIDGIIKDRNFSLPYQPHATKILDCYIDHTIFYQGVNPTWTVVTGSTAQLHFNYIKDHNSGNEIARYTYNADIITSLSIIECNCECLRQCPFPCHFRVRVTLEGMFFISTVFT